MKRSHIKEGMVFGIPMPDQRLAVIQLIRKQSPIFYMAAFDLTINNAESCDSQQLDHSNVLFMGNFFDDLIKNDHWRFLGHSPVREVPFPLTRVLISGDWIIESWDRTHQRTLEMPDAARFPYRTNSGAMVLEEALLYHYGFIELDEWMTKTISLLRADFVRSIADID